MGLRHRLATEDPPTTAPPNGSRGIAGDERSDIFSLAAVLHHLLTGEPPNAEARAAKSIPRAVRSVLSRALETLPTHRFGTVAAFAQALEAASSEEVMRHERAGRGRRGVVAVGTGLGVVAAAAVWLLTSMDRTQPELAAEGRVSVSGSDSAAQVGESIRSPPVPRKPAPAVSPESGAADPKHRGVSSDDSRSSDASDGQPPVRDELSVTPESIAVAEEVAAEEALAAEILEREGTSEPAVPAPRRLELSPSVQAHSEAVTGPAEVRHEPRERPQPKAVVPEKFGAGAGTPSGDPGRAPRAKTSASADSGLGYAMSDGAEPPRFRPSPPLVRSPAMRLALSDVMRLQIAARYEEVKPGVLVLELGAGYGASRSLGYTLERLYNGIPRASSITLRAIRSSSSGRTDRRSGSIPETDSKWESPVVVETLIVPLDGRQVISKTIVATSAHRVPSATGGLPVAPADALRTAGEFSVPLLRTFSEYGNWCLKVGEGGR